MSHLLSFIEARFSPIAFEKKAIEEEKIHLLFEAARRSPSSRNEQPWRFIYATSEDKELFTTLLSCLDESNQAWVQYAPFLMITISKTNFDHQNKPNRHHFHDVGLATSQLIIQGMSMDLYSHPMAGFSIEKAKKILEIPEGYEPVAMVAIGYLGDANELPSELKEKSKKRSSRKALTETVFKGKWGNSVY